jgi:hypothetical protein
MARDTLLLAVLIDADNSSAAWAEAVFEEIAALGEASVRRIYGDFTNPHLKGWQAKLAPLALVPHHAPANTIGTAEANKRISTNLEQTSREKVVQVDAHLCA